MKVMHPEKPDVLLYDGPTQLTFYRCVNEDCSRYEIPYQIREQYPDGKPVFEGARTCGGCGRKRRVVKNTTQHESA